jgi:aromatic ring-opening dioxygenase catalytic subunit (LigB family)
MMTAPKPPMLYDYYGFPEAAYTITWPAPGAPWLAPRVRTLLAEAGIDSAEDDTRGFDHGTFVPLKLTYPDAGIPTAQLSLKAGLHPAEHLAIGAALAPLRDEGVFIVGSGMTFHNIRIFGDARARPIAETFDAWLRSVMARDINGRTEGLLQWTDAPMARMAHPREEHLIPLMVIAGAAGTDAAALAFNETFGHLPMSAFHFGV